MKPIHSLTGLRGLAAVTVFVSHGANLQILPSAFGQGLGQLGVMLFFVLSGFLMTHLYIERDLDGVALRRYVTARVGRVVPLYFGLILLSLAISHYADPNFAYDFRDFDTLVRAVTFVEAPYVFWTIPVEMKFYVVFLGAWWLRHRGCSAAALVLFALLITLPGIALSVTAVDSTPVLPSYPAAFFLGLVTALFQHRLTRHRALRRAAAVAELPLAALLFTSLGLRSHFGWLPGEDPDLYSRTWSDPLSWAIVYGLFLCAIARPRDAFLNSRPLVLLGTVSYGFYLMHYPVLVYSTALTDNRAAQALIALATTLLLSYLSFRFLERPAADWIRRSATGTAARSAPDSAR